MMANAGLEEAGAGRNALHLIAQGIEQCVYLPGKMMLSSLMKTLGATEDNVVKVMPCEGIGYKGLVDVSPIRTVKQNAVAVSFIEGEVCATEQDAESSCVQEAFRYITNVQNICIKDYSRRVVNSVHNKDAAGLLSDALHGVRQIIDNWIVSINFSDDLSRKLENKEAWSRVGGASSPSGEVYICLYRSIDKIVTKFSAELYEARTRMQHYEAEMRRQTDKAEKFSGAYLSKGYFNTVQVSQKDVLSFVLDYIGAGKANYVNSKGGGGCVNTELVFFMPYLKDVKFVGNLKVHGRCLTSDRAEEHAAYKALRFIEKNHKVKVVDFNYNDRMEASKVHNDIVGILAKVVAMAKQLQSEWSDMLECLNELADRYYVEPRHMYASDEQIEAYAFCKENSARLKKEYEKNYNACEKEFNEMHAINNKINYKSFYMA